MPKFMSESDFAQAMRDADRVGIPRAVAYQSIKDKGYTIENEPTPKPSIKTSGDIFGYLADTAVSALKELGAVAKFGGEVITRPSKILETGRDIIKGAGTIAVGAGQNLYENITGNLPPTYNPDGTITYPKKSIYADNETGGTPEQRAATGLAKSAVEAVYSPSVGQFKGEGFTLPETFKEHPLSTLSVLAPMGSGILGRASQLSKAGEVVQAGRGVAGLAESAGLAKTASALSTAGKVSSALDPMQAVIKAPSFALNQGSKLTKGVMGEVSGAGAGAIEEAIKAKKATSPFFEALRDENQVAQAEKLVQETQNGLQILRQRRNAQYLKTNEALRTITEPIDRTPIQNILKKNLDDFRIGTTEKDLLWKIANMDEAQSIQFLNEYMQTKGGTLSPLVEAGIGEGASSNKIAKAINYVENWSDYTPDGLDRLRKSLTSINAKLGTTEGTFIGKLKSGIKEQVVKQYPEYSKMLGEYAEASDFIDDLTASIGNMDKAGIETHVRKLAQSMKTGNQGFEIRNALLSQLEEVTGIQIKQRLAGMALSKYAPRGLAGVGAGVGTMATLTGILSPQYLLAIAMSSPRLMGEVLGAIGVAKDQIATVITRLRGTLPPTVIQKLDETVKIQPPVKQEVRYKSGTPPVKQEVRYKSGTPPVKQGKATEISKPRIVDLSSVNDVNLPQVSQVDDMARITPEEKATGLIGGSDYVDNSAKVGQSAKTTKDIEPLLAEARKYKSAEEFIRALKMMKESDASPQLKKAIKNATRTRNGVPQYTESLTSVWHEATGTPKPAMPDQNALSDIKPEDLLF